MSAALAAFILGLMARDLWPFALRRLRDRPDAPSQPRPRKRLPRPRY